MTPPPARQPTAALTPRERLALTRAQLHSALLRARSPAPPPASAGWREAAPAAAALLDQLKTLPGMAMVLEALGHWWAQHPLRSVSLLTSGALKAALQPLAQRNPYLLAGTALVLGALLAWSRPWRLARNSGLLGGLLNGLGSALVAAAMARVPLQAWFSSLLAALTQQLQEAASAKPAPAAPAPGPAAPAAAPTDGTGPADGAATPASGVPQDSAAVP
jgi:hypothetical protein